MRGRIAVRSPATGAAIAGTSPGRAPRAPSSENPAGRAYDRHHRGFGAGPRSGVGDPMPVDVDELEAWTRSACLRRGLPRPDLPDADPHLERRPAPDGRHELLLRYAGEVPNGPQRFSVQVRDVATGRVCYDGGTGRFTDASAWERVGEARRLRLWRLSGEEVAIDIAECGDRRTRRTRRR
jgi:hypothetical protein